MNNKSFTLIELLVVIVIIGILAGVIMISTSSSIDKANIAKLKVFNDGFRNDMLLNLLSEWKFDDTSNVLLDSWGSVNATTNSTSYIPKENNECVSGGCISLNGTQDFKIADNPQFHLDDLTIMLWYYKPNTNSNSYPTFFQKRSQSGTVGYLWSWLGDTNRDDVYWQYANGTSMVSRAWADVLPRNESWYHLVFVYNRTNQRLGLYVNGEFKNWNAASGILKIDNSSDLIFGSYDSSAGHYIQGKFDDIRFFNNILSSSQIKQNYIAGLDSLLSNGNISKEDYNRRINELAYEK
ncbi:MAG: prepilin-type N-terminal cleavage/methylation domain-containing protein [Bacteroidales bacterium]|nr:prepilin-type N-terminal cleavage/methylation domain-containing protein [Bacteroidales bacterium]